MKFGWVDLVLYPEIVMLKQAMLLLKNLDVSIFIQFEMGGRFITRQLVVCCLMQMEKSSPLNILVT